MRWPAPAKINLFLHVLGRREDGYHNLETLFQLLDWGDELEIESRDDGQIVRTCANYEVGEEDDLVIRAARLLQSHCNVSLGANIGVDKVIPAGAGLGGGSSDAATVLLVLNGLWDCGLSQIELARLGQRLGADVPVFVSGQSALAGGIGEQLEPVRLENRHYVLVFPRQKISTEAIFSDPGLKRNSAAIGVAAALRGDGRNDCESVVRERYPEINRLMEDLASWGHPRMTGTGSTVFISFDDKSRAKSAAQELKNHYNVRAVSGVNRSALHEKMKAADFG